MRKVEASKAFNLLSLSWHWEQRKMFWRSLGIFFFSASPHFSIPLWWTFSMAQESKAIPDRSIPAIFKNLTVYASVSSHIFDLACNEKCMCFRKEKSPELVGKVKNTSRDWLAKLDARKLFHAYCLLLWPQHFGKQVRVFFSYLFVSAIAKFLFACK